MNAVPVGDEFIPNMSIDDLGDDRCLIRPRLDEMRQFALKAHRSRRDPLHRDTRAGHQFQTSEEIFVEIGGCINRRQVHRLAVRLIHQVNHKFASISNVQWRVLEALLGVRHHSQRDRGRVVAQGVEEAEWREVAHPFARL